MNNWLRWSALVPATIFAWLGVLVIGTFVHGYLERAVCPPEDLISGYCTNAEAQAKLKLVIPFFAGLSAVAVILSAVLVAPAAKSRIAWAAVTIGGTVALTIEGIAPESISAIVFGVVTAAVVSWHV